MSTDPTPDVRRSVEAFIRACNAAVEEFATAARVWAAAVVHAAASLVDLLSPVVAEVQRRRAIEEFDIPESDIRDVTPSGTVRLWNGRRVEIGPYRR